MTDRETIAITDANRVVSVRVAVRQLMDTHLGFSNLERMQVITAVSELSRNICDYAGQGEVDMMVIIRDGKRGIKIIFQDTGPGIPDLEAAMRPKSVSEYTKGMGIGLSGSKKLADEFDIKTGAGQGTIITWIKWERRPGQV